MAGSHKPIPHLHFWLFGLTLALITPLSCWALGPSFGFLVGFDVAALVFLTSTFTSMRITDAAMMRYRAQLNDAQPSPQRLSCVAGMARPTRTRHGTRERALRRLQAIAREGSSSPKL